MLENFAGSPAPANPLDGMLWWDVRTENLMVYNELGSPVNTWQFVVDPSASVGFGVAPGDGLEQTGSPVGRNYEPSGSPLTLEMQVKTGNTGLQNIVVVNANASSVDDRIFTSQDGISWTKRTSVTTVQHHDVAYSSATGRFVVVHQNRDVSYSDDGGITWTLSTDAFPSQATDSWIYIDYIESLGLFLAGNESQNGADDKIAYSADGLSWSLADTSSTWSNPDAPITSKFVEISTLGVVVALAYDSNNSPDAANVVWSSDGITWTYIADAIASGSGFHTYGGIMHAIAWSDTLDTLIATLGTGSSSKQVRIYSYDTSSAGSPLFASGWSNETTTPPWGESGVMSNAVWGDDKFVVVGRGTTQTSGSPDSDKYNLLTSTDGSTWEGHEVLGPGSEAGAGTYLGNVEYIPSLGRWITTAGADENWSITFAGSPFAARVAYSDDGLTWFSTVFPFTDGFTQNSRFNGIAFGEATADGVTVNADSISINESEVSHDALSGFSSSEHTDHSSITLSGNGITGGDLTASRTIAVNDGDGITANPGDVQVDATVVRTGGDTWGGVKTFTVPMLVGDGAVGTPSYSFNGDTNTGMYRIGADHIGFTTAGSLKLQIDSSGVLSSNNATYEILVTEDDDIPNKKYVNDVAAGAGSG